MRKYKTSLGKTLVLSSKKLDKGGEADIYQILQPSQYKNCVAKIYRKKSSAKFKKKMMTKETKLKYMTKHLISKVSTRKLNDVLILPIDTIYCNNEFIGYVMPYVKDKVSLIKLLLNDVDSSWDNLNLSSTKDKDVVFLNRLIISYNVVKAIKLLHGTDDVVLVDLKPDNILVSKKGDISLIDLDSIQINTNKVFYPADVVTREYVPRENSIIDYKNEPVNKNWDYFILGSIVYCILIGVNPFSAYYKNLHTQEELLKNGLFVHGKEKHNISYHPTSPHNNYKLLDVQLQNLFQKCLDQGSFDPNLRPNLDEWESVLFDVIQSEKKGAFPPKIKMKYKEEKDIGILSWDIENANEVLLTTYHESYKGGYKKFNLKQVQERGEIILPLFKSKYEIYAKNDKKSALEIIEISS